MSLRERLDELDRMALGAADDAESRHAAAPWVKLVAFLTPALAGCAVFAASFIDRGASLGILIGMLFALPIGLLAREAARSRRRW